MTGNLERVWHGGMWRDFVQPVARPEAPVYDDGRRRPDLHVAQRVMAVLSDDWQTPRQIGAVIGRTNTDAIGMVCWRLVQKGYAERSLGPSTGGRPGWRYRRVT